MRMRRRRATCCRPNRARTKGGLPWAFLAHRTPRFHSHRRSRLICSGRRGFQSAQIHIPALLWLSCPPSSSSIPVGFLVGSAGRHSVFSCWFHALNVGLTMVRSSGSWPGAPDSPFLYLCLSMPRGGHRLLTTRVSRLGSASTPRFSSSLFTFCVIYEVILRECSSRDSGTAIGCISML